ncbi:MAG: hypothetical protein ACRDHF_13920 [Tepidiformaceae bacterium]
MTQREDVARAMAFFDESDDIALLHQLTGEVAPRVKRMVGQMLSKGSEESIPPPADLRPAREAATQNQALATLRAEQDFALLQVIARSIGRRIETLEIAASADFPEGVNVRVPEEPRYPRAGRELPGTVEDTGTSLRVRLDNGETWEGPPSLARLAAGQ